jgi:GMP reductase
MRIEEDIKLDFDDVLIKPIPSELESRSQVNLNVSYIGKHSNRIISGFPVIVSNLDSTGTIEMAEALYHHKTYVSLHKYIEFDKLLNWFNKIESKYTFYTVGISDNDFNKLIELSNLTTKLNNISIDTPNGYMYKFLDRIKIVRDRFPNCNIMAGNVITPEGVENIIKAGADIAKCGIASGGLCNTKNKAGVGSKQLSVAIECGQTANELNALACSDGGVKTSADICKALASGSHFLMAGSIFCGYKECSNKPDENGQCTIYGMSSKIANDKYNGGLKNYRADEGKVKKIPYKNDSVITLIEDIKGSLASCCTYTNTKNLENLKKNVTFIKV